MGSNERYVLALGFFDGVHRGHSVLMETAKRRAKELGAEPGVLTFDTHPDTLVKGVEVPLINSSAGRVDILNRIYGIEKVVFLHFDDHTMKMAPENFVLWLKNELHAVHLVVGHDFHFGYKGRGNPQFLREFCKEHEMGVDVIEKVSIGDHTISSTYIRQLLLAGDIERANEFLGHPHTLIDTVRYGYKIGRTIETPTINMRFPEGVLIPPYGVYATKVVLDDGAHIAVTNIGVRPTFGDNFGVTVESYILDFNANLYGRQVRVEFYKFLRPEMKFNSPEALKAQIQQDAKDARACFEKK